MDDNPVTEGAHAAPVDLVNHPPHYTRGPEVECPNCHSSFILECIQVTRRMSFDLGNAVKYIWRVGFGGKQDDIQDLSKAVFYVEDDRIDREKNLGRPAS